MSVIQQGPDTRDDHARWYSACLRAGCGVCGPIRETREAAATDDREHRKVCSARRRDAHAR